MFFLLFLSTIIFFCKLQLGNFNQTLIGKTRYNAEFLAEAITGYRQIMNVIKPKKKWCNYSAVRQKE